MKKTKKQKNHDQKHIMSRYYNKYLMERFERDFMKKINARKRNNLKKLRATIASVKADYFTRISCVVHTNGIVYNVKQNRVEHIDWRFF